MKTLFAALLALSTLTAIAAPASATPDPYDPAVEHSEPSPN